MKQLLIFAALLLVACENREEPVQFEITAQPYYSFPSGENAASFSITTNTLWEAVVTSGGDWCNVTPTSANGDAIVKISVTANIGYLIGRTDTIAIRAGTFSKKIIVWQSRRSCPTFDAGSIATTGQTIFTGGTPIMINSLQNATGAGSISYQWYKNDWFISDATDASYTPPPSDARVAGTHTYTRRAKDDICQTQLTHSTGSWVLTVLPCNFSVGTISSVGQTIFAGEMPDTITSLQNATSRGVVSYQWFKNGEAINGATDTIYTPPTADATVAGAYTYTRSAKDDVCNTTFTQSAGSWALTVKDCSLSNAGTISSAGQTVFVGGTPAAISNLQPASGGGIVTYQWYKNDEAISGATNASYTPPSTVAAALGSHTYTRRAKDDICNTTFTQSAGSWVLSILEEFYPSYSGGAAAIWSCGAQIWSGALSNPVAGCEAVTTLSTANIPPAQYKNANNGYGYYYNWTCVNSYGANLCPTPWRVPIGTDFARLISCVGGDNTTGRTAIINAWGLPGYADSNSMLNVGVEARFWTASEYNSTAARYFYYSSYEIDRSACGKSFGYQVRCVR